MITRNPPPDTPTQKVIRSVIGALVVWGLVVLAFVTAFYFLAGMAGH